MYTRAQIEAEKIRRANAKIKSIEQQQQAPEAEIPESEYQESPFMSGVTGFNTAIERPVQGLMQLITGDKWKGLHKVAAKREADYERSAAINPGSTLIGDILGNLGLGVASGPAFGSAAARLAPVTKSSPYLQNILAGVLGGGALGGAQYVEPDESRLANALEGAGIGGGISAVVPGIGRALPMAGRQLSRMVGSTDRMMKDFLKNFTPEEMKLALENANIAKRINVPMTPAEAGQNKIASKLEGRLGTSPEGERNLYEFKKGQKSSEYDAIQKMLDEINPNPANAYEQIRNIGKEIISKREKALAAKARPYYEAAENVEISPNKLNSLTKDGNINAALQDVLKDPRYASEIKGFGANSIKVLDEVKKRLDGAIGQAVTSGDKNLARIIRNSKDKLVDSMDAMSKDYAKARSIYSAESPLIDLLRNRQIGKIANLDDSQIKQVGNIIFDAGEIDNRALARMAVEFNKENPEAWSRIIRNYMENKLATSYAGRTGYHGTNFYNQFLANDKMFNKLQLALSNNPQAQKTLKDMRVVFKDTINQPTIKGTAALAKSSLDVPRSGPQFVSKLVSNLTGGHYDKAMIDIITTDKWQKAFEKALKEPTKEAKQGKIIELLDEVTSIGGKALAAKHAATKGPYISTENYDLYD